MHARVVLGVDKGVLLREVSSFQRLKCVQERYILGAGKGVLFREVSSGQRSFHRIEDYSNQV